MKKLFLIIAAIIMFAVPALAVDLISDPQAGITHHDIEINGVVVVTDHPAAADGSLLYNLDGAPPGQYIFRARGKETVGGWASDWSDPYEDRKPGKPGGLRIR